LWSFQGRDTKLERFLAKNQHTQRKLLNFENWSNGELSKIELDFRKSSDLKINIIKKCAPQFIFFYEKKLERFG
jgi:TnpA family transposase